MEFVLLDDAGSAGISRLYLSPTAVLRLMPDHLLDEVTTSYFQADEKLQQFLHQAEEYLARGWYAVLLSRYELAGILHRVPVYPITEPLIEIRFYQQCQYLNAEQVALFLADLSKTVMDQPAGIADLSASIDQIQFEQAIKQLQDYLAQGHSYQINFTYRLNFKSYGSPLKLYQRLRQRQPVAYGALMRLEQDWILSFSPELFVRRQQKKLCTKPMKGTAPRTGQADQIESMALANDAKNRTENIIIVDLLRNDLGRISEIGSVTVPKLFEIEAHPSVWQMTSTICSNSAVDLSLYALLQALFPCGSVTGAPKRRSLEIIHELETRPRRLYCGALGWIDPPINNQQDRLGDFCFSVPIRTILIDQEGNGELGLGAGITYDSNAVDEYAECQTKAKFLTQLLPEFQLIETMMLNASGYSRLTAHLQRLQYSAKALGFNYCATKVQMALDQGQARMASDSQKLNDIDIITKQEKRKIFIPSDYRARLILTADGEATIDIAPITSLALPVKLMWSDRVVDSQNYLLRHKTSYRTVYDAAWRYAETHGCFDALFCNEHGEVTEGARSNLFIRIDQQWFTPAISCGLLPGIMRAELIVKLNAKEGILKREDVLNADALLVCNSLRGALPVELETVERFQ